MRIDILSLFPAYFTGPFDESIIARARKKNLLDIHLINIRDFAKNKHHRVDERPYGGGPGMVLMVPPIFDALASIRTPESYTIHLSPQGTKFDAHCCQRLATKKHLVLLCGHYEGIDQRIIDHHIDEEISIGDYVLTNGALASIVLVDAVARFVPGVLGDETAAACDSFQDILLDCPHYTQPEDFAGDGVPAVLKSGNHAAIDKWRHQSALRNTWEKRPELFIQYLQNKSCENSATIQQIIPCRDLQKSRRFYTKKLRMQQQFHGGATALLQYEDILQIFLVEQAQEFPLSLCRGTTLSITKEADFDLLVNKLSKENNHYVSIDRSNHIIYCHDPDQHLWCFRLEKEAATS